MPKVDPRAKAWEMDLAQRVGKAVKARRKALGLTAQQLERLTTDLGYPINRIAISKIETNNRAGKLDVAELLVLSAALDIPPILLLFPNYRDDLVQNLPGRPAERSSAIAWFEGEAPAEHVGLRGSYEPNSGEELIETGQLVGATDSDLHQLQNELARLRKAKDSPAEDIQRVRREIEHHERLLAALKANFEQHKKELWG